MRTPPQKLKRTCSEKCITGHIIDAIRIFFITDKLMEDFQKLIELEPVQKTTMKIAVDLIKKSLGQNGFKNIHNSPFVYFSMPTHI